jgi:hypothetical protein
LVFEAREKSKGGEESDRISFFNENEEPLLGQQHRRTRDLHICVFVCRNMSKQTKGKEVKKEKETKNLP